MSEEDEDELLLEDEDFFLLELLLPSEPEPDDDGVPLETYGGQPPELYVFDAPDLSPNAPISDVNAIPGIDQDPAPVVPGFGLAPEIAVSEIATSMLRVVSAAMATEAVHYHPREHHPSQRRRQQQQ